MGTFSSFPFVRSVFPLLIGIIAAIYVHSNSPFWMFATIFSFVLLIAETFILKISSSYKIRYFSGLLFFISFFFLGTFLIQLNSEEFYINHFNKNANTSNFYAEIIEAPLEKKSTYKVITSVKRIKSNGKWVNTKGKLLCYIEKNESYFPKQGDCILFSSKIQPIDDAKNPGQFDYKQYLYYHNIYNQTFVKSNQLKFVKREGNYLKNLAFDIRRELIRSFKNCGLKGPELAVTSALLFGVTDQLDPSLIRSYAGTGALHVLSVSGLHVAILYGFLQIVLGFLLRRKNGKLILGIIILIIIWFYAFLTGLTPSVLRSSTMFTFIVVGQILSRQSSVYNSIAASAFVLLCYDPFLIMEVGFQLSYLAVLGIIVLYPIINNQIEIKNKFIKPVWDITSVSIAAQIATFPLGLLYFHQFPNYFIFSNLLIIPLSGIILYTGIIASIFYFVPIIQFLLVYLIELFISFLNQIVNYIEKLPYALLEGISITILEASLLYLIFIFWLVWYRTSKPGYLKWIFGCALLICCLQIHESVKINNHHKLIVYNVNGATGIDLIHGKNHVFFADSLLFNDPDKMLFNVKHNWDDLNLNSPKIMDINKSIHPLKSIFRLKQNTILFKNVSLQIIDDKFNFKKNELLKTNYILLTKNANINLSKIKMENHKKIIFIADASNKFWRIEKWKEQAKSKKIRFYSTPSSGAFQLNL